MTHRVDTLVTPGVMTSSYIHTIDIGSLQHDYHTISTDAGSDRFENSYNVGLFDIDAKHNNVIQVDDVADSLERGRTDA